MATESAHVMSSVEEEVGSEPATKRQRISSSSSANNADDVMVNGNAKVETFAECIASLKEGLQKDADSREKCFRLARELSSVCERTMYVQMQKTQSASLPPLPTLTADGSRADEKGAGDWTLAYTEAAVEASSLNLLNSLADTKGPWPRNADTVSKALSGAVAVKCFAHFLKTGRLLSRKGLSGGAPSSNWFFDSITDSEYMIGCISFAHELQRYAILQATEGLTAPVLACKELVGNLLNELLRFDFRNGTLRRKYDGIKYVHKRLQDIVYELSLSSTHEVNGAQQGPQSALESSEFLEMCDSMAAFDEKREDVIKKSRAITKLSKAGIFSLHRKNVQEAAQKLKSAAENACSVYDSYIATEPLLRQGTFSNGIEEYVEGCLFESWLRNVDEIPSGERVPLATMTEVSKRIVDSAQSEFNLSPAEYLGGLFDLTGEIGRWAIAQATLRKTDKVRQALNSTYEVQTTVALLGEALPPKLRKKNSALTGTIKKLEHVLYELALTKGTGMRTLEVAKDSGANKKDERNGNDDE